MDVLFDCPVGAIVAFAGPKNKIPANWLYCDGTLCDRTETDPATGQLKYGALFNTIGNSWGGDGANKFALPALQGLFLRGVSDGTGVDPDAGSRDKSRPDLNSSGNGGDAVGAKQPDQVISHNHTVNPQHNFMDNSIGPNSVEGDGNVNYGPMGISTALYGGNETRPKNAYVYYIIKYK
ncbi:tail fiber protein [Mucilaginibacter sp. UR6-11]|uniref:tail fiber protein n=1 Tax=Mucilaginibacter sp. UR6-11 TaxID=1435644 RepID=UPI001E39739A|nr:tail fiber protein [Mucilaginibacter sp. UR6-11]MCC8424455.1 phage tail protein [Mucilaginibacter sp. UR6-11]